MHQIRRAGEMRNLLASGLLVLGLLLSLATATQAQNSPKVPASVPAVQRSGGRPALPNLTGVWEAARGDYDFASFAKGDPPMTAWGKSRFDASKPSQGPRGVSLKETTDNVYKCVPPGMPYPVSYTHLRAHETGR